MLGETFIFTLPSKVPLWRKCQNDVWCGNMNMDVSLYILKFKFFLKKYLFYNGCLESCWSTVVKNRNDIPSRIDLFNYYSYKHSTYSRYVLLPSASATKLS